ncbi:MAG: CpaF family protein [Lachnospiraceae bacterium]|nr:CpaF family protein [Lachnospiraceae bacterium]
MEAKDLLELQTQRGAKIAAGGDTSRRTLEAVTNDCRKAIEEQSDKYRDLNPLDKKETIKQIIIDFVMNTKPLVSGFIDGENKPDTLKLVDKLVEDITDYGLLSQAMMDDDVYEIRCNGKELKVEIAGHVQDLIDKEGNLVSFDSPEQQEIIMRKLLGDVRLTPKDALVNSRTIEGYRIAAIHNSAMSPDPNDPVGDQYHAFVLRKFRKSKMNLGQIVEYHTLSDNMARLLALCTAGGLTFFTVGPTASGKTTTNNAILQSVPATTRTILIQNPSEIDLRFKDASGRIYNDVLHLEASEKENPTPSDPTMRNLMDHTLRLSPTFVCFGEIRTNPEFKQCMKIMQAGHPINTTFHAESSHGAIKRFLTAYLAESGNEPSHLALSTVVDLVNMIIVQKIMRDGTRRIIQISEVVGVDPENREEPKLNDLYIYDIDREPEYDEAGNVIHINGTHRRVGKLSPRTVRKFQLEGVASSRYDFLTVDVNKAEVETYTGKNIDRYGMK